MAASAQRPLVRRMTPFANHARTSALLLRGDRNLPPNVAILGGDRRFRREQTQERVEHIGRKPGLEGGKRG